jgi:hypothetical protein
MADALNEEHRRRVEQATVHLVDRGGRGVLVPGAVILSATHCIAWSGSGEMALGDEYPTGIETPGGVKFRVVL